MFLSANINTKIGAKPNSPDAPIYNITNTDLSADISYSMSEICRHYKVVHICLHDIAKQSGHPSVQGMKSISGQIGAVVMSEGH